MGGLIKLIKNLFSGIFSFLGGLVGGKKSIAGSAPKTKKSSGYFLELDDSEFAKKPAVSAGNRSRTCCGNQSNHPNSKEAF